MSCIKGELWTDEDKQIVFDNFLVKTKEQMLELFPNRTWKAIRHVGSKQGLKLTNNYEVIPKQELFKEISGIEHMKCKSCRRYLPFSTTHYPKDKNCRLGFRSILHSRESVTMKANLP